VSNKDSILYIVLKFNQFQVRALAKKLRKIMLLRKCYKHWRICRNRKKRKPVSFFYCLVCLY